MAVPEDLILFGVDFQSNLRLIGYIGLYKRNIRSSVFGHQNAEN